MQKINQKGLLFVLSGASGTGKTTLCRFLEKRRRLFFSVSMTTRQPRSNEVHAKDYLFVSQDQFKEILSQGGFLEHAEVHGNFYGTPKQPILESLDKGQHVLLDIDVQGALQIKKQLPDAVLIFIMTPSIEELKKRLQSRGTDSSSTIEKRIQKAQEEIAMQSHYDYVVINRDLEKAKLELQEIIHQESKKAGH